MSEDIVIVVTKDHEYGSEVVAIVYPVDPLNPQFTVDEIKQAFPGYRSQIRVAVTEGVFLKGTQSHHKPKPT